MLFRKKENTTSFQTAKEEIANAISHGIGTIFSIWGLVVLIYYSIKMGTVWHVVSTSIYGATLIFLFLSSTLYHAIFHKKAKIVFRRLDHISIFLLIFGTYTPLLLIILHGTVGWVLFSIQIAFCLIGITIKAIYGPRYEKLSVISYISMGWMAVFVIKPILQNISYGGVLWLFIGGVFYSLGILFYAFGSKINYFHTVWHIFVLLGSICHYILILNYMIPFTF